MRQLVTVLIAGVVAIAGCSTPPPPTPGASPSAVPSAVPSASPSVSLPLDVHIAGRIGCAQFPYSCYAAMSVLPPEIVVADDWRPPSTDPRWFAESTSTDHFGETPDGGPLMLEQGAHLLVASLIGSSDVPSYKEDGTVATDLLGRCSVIVDVKDSTTSIATVVTFTPSGTTFEAPCSLSAEVR